MARRRDVVKEQCDIKCELEAIAGLLSAAARVGRGEAPPLPPQALRAQTFKVKAASLRLQRLWNSILVHGAGRLR